MAYATIAQFRALAYTAQTTSQLTDAAIEAYIERASRMIDRACNAKDGYFAAYESGDNTLTVFYGEGTTYLKIGPTTNAATVTMPAAYTVPEFAQVGDFLIVTDEDGRLLDTGRELQSDAFGDLLTSGNCWPRGVPVSVTAHFGFSATPADIVQAVLELAIHLWRADPAFAGAVAAGNPSGFLSLPKGMPPTVAEVCETWRIRAAQSSFA